MVLTLLQSLINKTPPAKLYHYTSSSGLYGIITNKAIWATNIHYFNDSSEFLYAINMAKEILKYEGEFNKDSQFVDMILSQLSSIQNVYKYAFSLSECGDLLSQWRGYCPSTGGYAIGFDSNKLSEVVSKDHEFYLYPCQYDRSIQRSLILEVLHEALEKYQEVKKSFSAPKDISDRCWGQFTSRFEVVAAMIKDPSWSEEREWRVASHPLPITHQNFRIRVGKHYLIPYMEVPLGAEPNEWPFTNVIVGPNPHQALASDSVTNLLSINKISSWSVTHSQIPYREC